MSVEAAWTNKFQVVCLGVMLMRNTGGTSNIYKHFFWSSILELRLTFVFICLVITELAFTRASPATADFNGCTFIFNGHMWIFFCDVANRKQLTSRFVIFNTSFSLLSQAHGSSSLKYVSLYYWDSRNQARRGTCDTWGRCLNQPSNIYFSGFYFFFFPPVPLRNYQHCTQHLKLKDKIVGLCCSRL